MDIKSVSSGRKSFMKGVIMLAITALILTPIAPVFASEEAPIVTEVIPEETSLVPDETNEVAQLTEATDEVAGDDTVSDETASDDGTKKNEEPELDSIAAPVGKANDVHDPNSNRLSADIDSLNGSLTYQYDIVVPPGRNEMTPRVSLSYNSGTGENDSIVGYGWDIPIPYIQRINKSGTDSLYSENNFVSSLDGELIDLGSGSYKAKDENGSFNKYSFGSNTWTVIDKKGTVYTFGSSTATRQDNPSNSSQIFQWLLEEVRDTNDNFVEYEYYKDAGQVYPAAIRYSGHGSTDGIFEVTFSRETRPDIVISHSLGFTVTTNYRIDGINTSIDDVSTRNYSFEYGTGTNSYRSVLEAVTESGINEDNVTTTLPVISFNYTEPSATNWSETTNYNIPTNVGFVQSSYVANLIMDVNGDSFSDLVYESTSTGKYIYLNKGDGTGWENTTSWSLPTNATIRSGGTFGRNIADINGDRLPDLLVEPTSGTKYIFLNNGVNGWTDVTSSWNLPSDVRFITNGTIETVVTDINGDGFADILREASGSPVVRKIYINRGDNTGWDESSTWSFPSSFNLRNSGLWGKTIGDINGDGLVDLMNEVISGGVSTKYLYINNGVNGWDVNTDWVIPSQVRFVTSSYLTVALEDLNGDGWSDFIEQDSSGQYIYINDGDNTGWTLSSTWALPSTNFDLRSNSSNKGSGISDIDGDGLSDLIYQYQGVKYLYLNNGDRSDLMSEISFPQGGTTEIEYKPSAQYLDGSTILNPSLPLILDTPYQITTNDGLGNAQTTTFKYEAGDYYYGSPTDRKMAGFNKITKTDGAGNKTITYYHQGNTSDSSNGEYSDHASKIGKAYRSEISDSSNHVYAKTINKWDRSDLGSGRSFVKLAQTLEMTYDEDSDHSDKAIAYSYDDTYGNQTEVIEYGVVTGSNDGTYTDTGSDKLTTSVSYAVNTTDYIVGLPSQDSTVNQGSTKIRENKYYYDSQSSGDVTTGNLTKQEMWKSGSTYIDTENTYNSYGLVTQSKDPRDKTTDYDYDAYNLYPTTVTNALSQEALYTYDYSSGKPLTMTDVNGRDFEDVYDGLDRITAEKQPDISTPSTLVTKTAYTYTDTVNAVKVQQTDYLDGSNSVTMYTYFDGLGRPIQTRREMEDSNTYAVTDTIYNAVGKVYKQSLPYSSTGTSRTTPTTTPALLTTMTYDPMQRIISAVNAVGTTSNSYDDWKTTITDPRGKTKDLYTDAFGNLIQVDEHNGASTYTTTYQYDGNKNLTKITDALGNIRNFTFDGLNRRLTAEDLHATADTTFGTWTYGYDNSGNVTSTVNPNGQTVNYTFDDLNRPLTEDYTGQVGAEVTYTYDSGTDGVGRLTSVVSIGANTTYVYDALGNVQEETKTIDATPYETSYTYDRLGNQLEITNPDGSQVKYTYNTAGLLETVQRKETTDGYFIDVVTDYDYGTHGQITYQAFANGSATTNTYDSSKLYRLSNKITTITGGTKVQDLSFTYDNNGNITQIIDDSDTDSSKTVDYTYDDLNRILSATATSVAVGQSTYTQTYTYNAIGNILTKSDVTGSYSYDGNSGSNYANPHAVTSIGSVNYTYDTNGNLLTETGGLSNTWDYNNRLIQTVKGGITSNYAYDQSGSRVKLSDGTITTYYPSDNYSTDGTTATKHIFANGQMVATVAGTGVGVDVYTQHTDHLTGANAITNESGTLEELVDYFPFGAIRLDQKAGSFEEQRKFAGQEYDSDTGLSYMKARYYNSDSGRFISQDSLFWLVPTEYLLDPQQQNTYTYARNNPLAWFDPSGNKATVAISTDEKNHQGSIDISASFALWSPQGELSRDEITSYGNKMRREIQNAWGGSYSQDGINYSVNVSISFGVYANEKEAMSSGMQNVIQVIGHEVDSSNDSYVNKRFFSGNRPDTGTWNANSTTAAHEFTHLLGVHDRDGRENQVLSNTHILDMPGITRATSNDYSWAFSRALSNHRENSRSKSFGIKYGNPQSYNSSIVLKAGGIIFGWR